MKNKKWTTEEITRMLDFINYRRIGLSITDPIIIQLSQKLNRTTHSITKKLSAIKYKEQWEKYIAYHYQFHSARELAEQVGMSTSGMEKVLHRIKKKSNLVSKFKTRSPQNIVTLMRSSNLPSYHPAQFLLGSHISSHRLFNYHFGIPSRWFHGILYDDYFDLYDHYSDHYIQTTLKVGPKHNALLIPWFRLPYHTDLCDEIQRLAKFQLYIYGIEEHRDADLVLEKLLNAPIIEKDEVNLDDLKRKTLKAYESYQVIKEYLKARYSSIHRATRYKYRPMKVF